MHVLVLHGFDSSPTLVSEFALELAEVLDCAAVDVPEGSIAVGERFGWWAAEADPDAVMRAVDIVEPMLDPTGTVVVGFSQGGALAVALAARSPWLVRAAICGGGFLAPGVELADALPPLLVIHGDDDDVVDVFYAETLARTAAKAGAPVELQTWAGAHTWPPDAVTRIATWLGRVPSPS